MTVSGAGGLYPGEPSYPWRGVDHEGEVQGREYPAKIRRASIHNRFNQDRRLNRRDIFKQNRSTALAEWRRFAQ